MNSFAVGAVDGAGVGTIAGSGVDAGVGAGVGGGKPPLMAMRKAAMYWPSSVASKNVTD